MINSICRAILGKEIIIYHPHRNSNPIVNDNTKERYYFLNPRNFWIVTAIFGKKSKLRYRSMGIILSLINPVSIIDINWTYKTHSLYYAWCKKNKKKFIVIQHGIYFGGMMMDIKEKYSKCTTHLVWGKHFKKMRERDNPGKSCKFIIYGNPVYNQYDRNQFVYKKNVGNNILVAVSVIKDKRLKKLYSFLEKLKQSGFNITIKEHNHQATKASTITGYSKCDINLYKLLKEQRYDYVITDVSSAMVDAIFFKNRAIYFSPEGSEHYHTRNVYEEYLVNIATRKGFFTDRKDLLNQISIETQENMLKYLIETEGTTNTLEGII